MSTAAVLPNAIYYPEPGGRQKALLLRKDPVDVIHAAGRFGSKDGYNFLKMVVKTSEFSLEVIRILGKNCEEVVVALKKFSAGASPAVMWLVVPRAFSSLTKLSEILFAAVTGRISWADLEKELRDGSEALTVIGYSVQLVGSCVLQTVPSLVLQTAILADATNSLLALRHSWKESEKAERLSRAEAFAANGSIPSAQIVSLGESGRFAVGQGIRAASSAQVQAHYAREKKIQMAKVAKAVCTLASMSLTFIAPPLGFVAPKIVDLTFSFAGTACSVWSGIYGETALYVEQKA